MSAVFQRDQRVKVVAAPPTDAHWIGATGTILYAFADLDGCYWLQMDAEWDDGDPKWFMPHELAVLEDQS